MLAPARLLVGLPSLHVLEYRLDIGYLLFLTRTAQLMLMSLCEVHAWSQVQNRCCMYRRQKSSANVPLRGPHLTNLGHC